MENITTINAIIEIFVSIFLIIFAIFYRKLATRYSEQVKENIKLREDVENAIYNIEDLEKCERPFLVLDQTIADIKLARKKSEKFDNIQAEYQKLVVEYPKLEKELEKQNKLREMDDHAIQKVCTKAGIEGTFLKEYWLAVFESTIIKKLSDLELLEKVIKIIREEFNTVFSEINNPITKSITSYANFVITQYKENEKAKEKAQQIIQDQKKDHKKRIHVKDQIIFTLRKKLGIKAPRKNSKKTGQN